MKNPRRSDHQLKDGRTVPIFIHSTIDDMTDLTPNAMRVYMHLSRRADKSGAAWPSYQSIGNHCFGSVYDHPDTRRRHAVKAIADLVDAGLIHKGKRKHPRGQQSNCYTLLEPVIAQSQPGVTQGSQGYVIAQSQPFVIEESQEAVIVGSPKDTPIKNTPNEEIVSSPVSAFVDSPKPATATHAATAAVDWGLLVDELTLALRGELARPLRGSVLEPPATAGAAYRLLLPPGTTGVDHFTHQAGPDIRRRLGSVLGKPVKIEIVAAEAESEVPA